MEPMYRGVPGETETTSTSVFHASTDTEITVYDVSRFPAAPNWITVRMANRSCLATYKYTGISGNTITGLTFEESDIPLGQTADYPIGSSVYWSFTNKLLDNMITNIESGGGGGTTDYNALSNKPLINGVELTGNKTPSEIGVLAKYQGTENKGKYFMVDTAGDTSLVDLHPTIGTGADEGVLIFSSGQATVDGDTLVL